MKILTECGLVCARKEWKNTYYSLNCETLTEFRSFIDGLNCCSKETAPERDCCCGETEKENDET